MSLSTAKYKTIKILKINKWQKMIMDFKVKCKLKINLEHSC